MEFDLDKSILILKRTPGVLRALVGDLPEEWTHRDYGPQTWTAHQVVGHLIWGDRTDWMPRAKHILEAGDDISFEPFDRKGHLTMCRETKLHDLLAVFAKKRIANLDALQELSLSPEQLQKCGRHPDFGIVTLSQLLATWTVHDLHHIAQICKAIANQYQDAVGPWEAYLSILAPPNPR